MEIMHIWDQCGFAKNIARLDLGPKIQLSRVGRLPEYGYASRAVSTLRLPLTGAFMEYLKWEVKRNIKRNVIFETHTPFFFELFPELASRTIFHAHGSEIRRTDSTGLNIDQVNLTTKFGLENALRVFFSTPDLQPIIDKYSSNSLWVPHFASPRIPVNELASSVDIFFASSWDTWKGARLVLKLIGEIRETTDGLSIAGINLGELAPLASSYGVELLPTMDRVTFNRKLGEAKVVIGQGFGMIGASDLEAILVGNQFFSFKPDSSWFNAYGFEDSDFMPQLDLVDRLSGLVNGSIQSRGTYMAKIKRTHSAENISSILQKAYSSVFN